MTMSAASELVLSGLSSPPGEAFQGSDRRLSLASRVSATIFRAFALMAFHLAAAESNTD